MLILYIEYIPFGITLLNIPQLILYWVQFCTQFKGSSVLYWILSGPFLVYLYPRKYSYDHVELLYC